MPLIGSFGWGLTPGPDLDFWVRFYITMFPDTNAVFARNIIRILIGSNFVPIGPKILGHWAQTL